MALSKHRFVTSAWLMSCLIGGCAFADDLSGVYIGASFGRVRNDFQTRQIDENLANQASSAGVTIDLTDRSTQRWSDGWWADAGYFFSPYVGVDAAFMHLGEIRYIAVGTVTTAGTPESLSRLTEITSHGPALSLIGRLPLTEALALELRVGDYYGKSTLDDTLNVAANSTFSGASKSRSSLLAGVGVAYSFAGHWSIRADYLRVQSTGDASTLGKYNIDLGTAGVRFTF